MSEEEKRGPGRPPKPAEPSTVTMVILRDYWQTGDLSDGDRVKAGTKVDVSVDAAMAGIESGAMRRATEADK